MRRDAGRICFCANASECFGSTCELSSERICAHTARVPSPRVNCRTFVAVPAPLNLKDIVEEGFGSAWASF